MEGTDGSNIEPGGTPALDEATDEERQVSVGGDTDEPDGGTTLETLDKGPIPGLDPDGEHSQVVRDGDFLQLGRVEQALGAEAAEEFLNEPDPFDEARRSAAAWLGRTAAL